MKESDIVFVMGVEKEGMFIGRAFDVRSKEIKCIVHCTETEDYIVDEEDLVFVKTLEEELRETFSGIITKRLDS